MMTGGRQGPCAKLLSADPRSAATRHGGVCRTCTPVLMWCWPNNHRLEKKTVLGPFWLQLLQALFTNWSGNEEESHKTRGGDDRGEEWKRFVNPADYFWEMGVKIVPSFAGVSFRMCFLVRGNVGLKVCLFVCAGGRVWHVRRTWGSRGPEEGFGGRRWGLWWWLVALFGLNAWSREVRHQRFTGPTPLVR